MNEQVAAYIASRPDAWQTDVCNRLRDAAWTAIPDAQERLQYGKPHYLKNGKYAAVISAAKNQVSFTIFNAAGLDAPNGLFEPGPPERRTVKIKQDQAVDYDLLCSLLTRASATL
jgi:hypothetical protein